MNRALVLNTKQHDGVSWYRLDQFIRYSQINKHLDVQYFKPELKEEMLTQIIEKADGYFIRPSGDVNFVIYDVIEKYKPKHKALFVDIDDNFTLVNPFSDMYGYFGTREIQLQDGQWLWKNGQYDFDTVRNIKRLVKTQNILKNADLITTTTLQMKNWIENYNKRVVVVPNAIDKTYFPYLELKKDNIVRVGWAGGSSHYEDLMTILPTLSDIMKKYPHVHYYHIGNYFGVIDKYLPKDRTHIYGWINSDGHGYRMASFNLDIGLCPLTSHEFNHYKSCIKFYEYSAIKACTLAFNSLPYSDEVHHGENGYLYKDAQDFGKNLEYLILNPLKRTLVASNAYEFVYKYRSLDSIAYDWATVINAVINEKKNDRIHSNIRKKGQSQRRPE